MNPIQSQYNLNDVLNKAALEEPLGKGEIVFLLSLEHGNQIDAVFETATKLRARHFGDRIFLYGFLYISTFCRNQCTFCYYRSSNALAERYRRDAAEIIEAAQSLVESGVHLIDLTLGEDPLYFRNQDFESLIQLVDAVRRVSDRPL